MLSKYSQSWPICFNWHINISMLTQTNFTVSKDLLLQASHLALANNNNLVLNQPTGNFFYNPWIIKPEYTNTVWGKILHSLELPVGEARVILLDPATNYQIHADIDDRYHLNISGDSSYLIDFNTNKLHLLEASGVWYNMDAGRMHSAANFGKQHRVQLVVRQLLTNSYIDNAVRVKLYSDTLGLDSARFTFDNIVSPWLNKINKKGALANFKIFPGTSVVEFTTNVESCDELTSILTPDIKIEFLNG